MLRFVLLSLLLTTTTIAAETEDSTWSKPDIEPLMTELVLELKVKIDSAIVIGESDKGVRQFIPITGGTLEGKGIKGEVLSGGADWQLIRPDGVIEIKAIYAIKTDDGVVISIDNRGIIALSENNAYVRTAPTFQAPKGKYEWLNRRIFTGTITSAQNENMVIIRVFQVL